MSLTRRISTALVGLVALAGTGVVAVAGATPALAADSAYVMGCGSPALDRQDATFKVTY